MKNSKRLSKLALPLLFLFLIVSVVEGLTLTNVTPAWSGIAGGSGAPDCLNTPTVGAEVQIRFGDDDLSAPCPGSPNVQSGVGFEGGTTSVFTSGQPFVLGELTHYNNPVFASSLLEAANLDLTIDFSEPVYNGVFSTTMTLDETANYMNTCPYGDSQPCADRISVERQTFNFSVGAANYQLEILGLIPGTLGSCAFDQTLISTNFLSDENATNSACLFGTLTLLQEAEIIISKVANVTEAEAGDLITYQIDYNCFSTTTSCNGVVITDVLPDEVVYVGSTGSTHTTQSTGVYSADNHSVRFTFVNPLPAGSTGYVRVRARVRGDGTVANGQLIQNTAISTMTNGASNTAINTIPAVAYSEWEVVKTGPGTAYIDTDAPVTDATYTVGICPEDSTVNLLNAQMIDTLPNNAVFVSATGTYILDPGPPQTITWNLGDLNAADDCAEEQVTVRFPSPPFNSGDIVTNTVVASGTPVGEPPWTDSASVNNPLTQIVPDPRATLDKVSDRSSYIVGAIAQFRLNPVNTGNVPLQNFTVTDTLPAQLDVQRISVGRYSNYIGPVNIRYQSSNNPGVWVDWPGGPFPDNDQVLQVSSLGLPGGAYITMLQWQYGTALPGFSAEAGARIYAEIINPDRNGDPVTDGATINNTAELSWDYPPGNGGSGISGTDQGSASITVTVMPSPQFDKASAGGLSATWRFLIGQQVGYYTLRPNNNSGVALDDFIITDTPPAQFNVTGVTLGQYQNAAGVQVTVYYQSSATGSTWNLWSGPVTPNNQTLNVSSLGLGAAYITGVRYDFGTVPMDFVPSTLPRILGRVINPDNNGSPVDDGDTMTNNATLDWTYESVSDNLSDSQVDTVREPIAEPAPQKSEVTSGPYIPTSVVTYSLRIMTTSTSPSALVNPIVADLLPVGMTYVPGSWTFNANGTGAPNPIFEQIANYNGTGRTLLRWSFTGASAFDFQRNTSAFITFNVVIDPGVTIGPILNEYHLMSNDVPITPTTSDVNDLDGDGRTDDGLSGSSETIQVDELVGLDSVKGVRGELDTGFSVYPDTGRTIPGGDVTYRLSVINEGNIPIQNVKVIDILPFVGDTGVQDLSQRQSQWGPVLTGLVASPPGVTVYYSTSGNPCRPDIVSSGPAGCSAPNWSTLPPANVTTVRSLRFDFSGILDPGETFSFTWTMQAPIGAPEGEIAWNSFAFTSTNAVTGYPLRPAEPNKVGIEIEIPDISPLIELVKSTNGDDANLPTGPLIAENGTVTWTYLITNAGNTRLANITLVDDIIGPITCDEGPIPTLEIGDDFLCTTTGIATIGQYANIGTVEGTPVDDDDDPIIDPDTGDPVPPVTDEDPSHYFGYNPALAQLGNFVWIDADYDGIQDGGEVGLPGVTVNLLDNLNNVLDTTTTDGNGFYAFVDLAPGDYAVEFVPPPLYDFTLQDAGGDTVDSDANVTTGRTIVTTLDPGENDPTWDAGVIARASIGDYVWSDMNNNGIQDFGEPRIIGATVRLLDSGGTVINSTVTDPNGNYRFTDLPPGDYAVEFVLPAGYIFATRDAGGDDTRDSDADTTTGRTLNTTLAPGENDPTWDAGFVPLASIGDRVWSDLDADGIQDGGEPGVANVTVRLYDGLGTLMGTTTTNASGIYSFVNLIPGDYYVVVTLPSGYLFSPQDAGSNNNVDSDVDITTGQTITTTLVPDEDDLSWDAGLTPLSSIGDRVWLDMDNDGVQDGGESGFPGVTVNLLDGSGVFISTDTTDGSGNYLFDNLPPGNYIIEVILPADHVFSPQNVGSDSADSDVDRTTGRAAVTTLVPDEDDMTWDAGVVPDASIGDFVWFDDDNDGVQDGGEPPAVGVTVRLLNSGGTVIDTTTTDGSGSYLFDNLTPATYAIEFVPPANYVPARRDVGANDALDSDPHRFTNRTINTTLLPDEDDMTWDMGLVLAASIGDRVWLDEDGDGVQDGGEPGVQNVTVRLLDSTNTVIATDTSDVNGIYGFTDLPPDDYRIEVVLPGGYLFSLPDQTGDAADSDVDTTSGRSILTTLDPDEDDMTWDAGLVPVASIGNYVWRDNDNDGVQDAGEPGIAGITVNLLDSTGTTILATDVTDANGLYLFGNLRNGDYRVEFVLPATGYIRSPQDAGGNDATDSDASTVDGRTIVTTLDPDEDDMTWDAGLTPLGSIGNRVWLDFDMDGVQDGGEANYPGIVVNLLDSGGGFIATDTTDANGLYLFDNLLQGDYIVEFVLPTSTIFSPQNVGADTTDSDANIPTGETALINLSWGENDDTWDAGIIPLASIGDRVWYDSDDDGIQDGGESGFAGGVLVTLYNNVGTAIGTDTTDGSGLYSFVDLVPGTYSVGFTLPANHVFSRRDQGGNNNIDSDPDRTTGRTINTLLDPGENDISWDAGIMEVASLGDYVWYDSDDDGQQDAGEPPVQGVTVRLFDTSNVLIGTDVTDVNGLYLFENLYPGPYYVIFTAPAGHVFSRRDVGSNLTDSDPNRTTGRTANTTLTPGEDDMTWDAGVMEVASLGDLVWNDTNDNGLQDGGELGVPGVTVQLYTSAGTLTGTDITDASGLYLFDNLVPGDYYVVFTLPGGYVFSRQNIGADDAVDSDPNRTNPNIGRTANTTLLPNEEDLTWDAGIMEVASIGDYVWEDLDIDGVQEVGEPPIGSVSVSLYTGTGTFVSSTTTNGAGFYQFLNLVPGDYYVVFSAPAGYFFSPQDAVTATDATDSDANTGTGQTMTTTLLPGEDDMTWDAGMYRLASIGNFVWNDLDADGIQDGGELGVPGVTVTLFNGAGVQVGASTATNGTGFYQFNGLTPGDYYVEFTLPFSYYFSPQNTGADDTVDSDADTTTGIAATTTLISNENDTTWDAGIYQRASIGNFVWLDANGNGLQDGGGETGIQAIPVTLYTGVGGFVATVNTDFSGFYLFDNLVPGDYYVDFDLIGDYQFTTQNVGGDDTIDSDANPADGVAATTSLISGENDLTWDAGVYELVSIGDYVWYDTDADGVQDGTEVGIPNVTVTLYNGAGVQVGVPDTTDASGLYLFDNLPPGNYYVVFTLLPGYEFSPQDATGDTADSDANVLSGQTATTSLFSNEDDMTWDAGMYQFAALGDYVWDDLDADGVQETGEPPIQNVLVALYNGSGGLVSTDLTDASGLYLFDNLVPSDYYVDFTLPAGYVFSPRDAAAATDATDSDADTTTGETIITTLIGNESDLTWDAGMYNPASLGNFVWEDLDADGVQDAGEPGIPNVTVTLFNGAGVQVGAPTTTDANGLYLFDNLVPGDYYVDFTLPAGYVFSPRDTGADDTVDSDADTTTGQTIATTLISNEDDLTWDAGMYQYASLGNFVWTDTDADGVQDGGELGIPGVTVTLFNGAGVQVGAPDVTDANGLYLFDNLVPGDYYVDFTLPTGYVFSARDASGDTVDSDADTTNGETISTTLISNEDDLTWDAGVFEYASLGDFVWVDTDADGVQDGGESGLPGVTVTLFNGAGVQVGAPDTTDANGLYLFDNLVPGDYYVVFTLPAGYTFSPRDATADATDSDADITTGQTVTTTLISNEDDLTWDAGVYQVGSLGDYVWDDLNANGIQDAGEPGIPNVTVTLFNGAGVQVGAPTTTDANGLYLFDNLVPGDYYVDFTLPTGYNFSPRDTGADDTVDSDADTTTGQTIPTTLITNEDDLTWDAGMYNPASLGNFVWEDLDADGVQEAGEPPIPNVTVTLYNGAGVQVGIPTTTDANGLYLFDNLVPGDYYVVFTLPAGYVFSPRDAGGNDATDSDADTTTGRTITTTLISNEDDLTWDAGMFQYASLGDYVWEDLDADGIQDAGEPPLVGVSVTLFNGAGVQVGSPDTTDASGLYLFDNLVPGDYYVDFTLPAGYNFSPRDAGGDTVDSDADTTTGQTIPTTLISNEDDLTWDAGMYVYASLGNFVWTDTDADGVQDGGEPGIPGVTVTLFNGAGVQVGAPDVTDASGLYLFDNLVPGDYYVVFTLPTGYVFSPRDATTDANDSDPDITTGQTITTTLISDEDDLTWDAGVYQLASIGNYVWEDMDADGLQEAGEPPIPNVTVTLFNGAGVQVGVPTTTDASGLYLFDNLVPGDYYVDFTLPAGYVFSPRDAGADDTVDSDADTTTGQTVTTTLITNEDDLTWDAGMYQYASLGDYVWDDLDADGIQEAGEPPIPNVTVTLFNGAGVQVGTPDVTDASGLYLFDNLVPGDYYVVFTLPTDYVFTPQNAGADDTVDSDANTTTGRTGTTTLISNEDDLTWDAGMYIPPTLGDYVWDDLNGDGVQDAGEPGVPGVTVTLFTGAGVQVGAPDVTDSNGLYLFDNLVPGDYYVVFTPPTGYVFTPQDTTTDATDSDANVITRQTINTTLISGEDDLTWDAGIFIPPSIGNYVWEDLNADGIQDAGEPGVPGVTVTLYNVTNATVYVTTTDSSGLYLIANLTPGEYYIVFTPPTDYVFSPQDSSADDASDSDADTTTGQTTNTILISDEDDMTWDAGMYQYASLGDYVWDDLNADGVQDAGEPGVENVTVTLYDDTNAVVDTTTTDATGLYLFDTLVPGDYYVVFTLPTDYYFSPQDQRGDDAADSDADITTGQAATTTLISNEDDLTWDAGIYQLASIGDFMWYDSNANGIQDIAEAPVVDVEVTLYDGTGVQVGLPTRTDVDGLYSFIDLVPGDYYVRFDLPADYLFTLPDRGLDDTLDSDVDEDGRTDVTDLISGEDDPTWDAGIVPEPKSATVFSVTPTPVPPTDGDGSSQPAPACSALCVNWMLYHTNQTGDWEIFRLGDMEGSINANLSQGEGANDIAPTRSPNAEWVVFASDRDDNWELYLAPSNGDSSLIRRLTFNTIAIDTDPVWGPGNYVVFESTRSGNWDLYLMDMTNGRVRQITDNEASDINAYWSPDGSKLIFQSDRSGQWQIYELDLGTLEVKLLSDGQGIDLDPQFSNGGSQIAFRSYRDGSDSVLHLMNADGSNVHAISDLEGDATDHSWSPDDTLIAYQSDLDGDLDIYVYEVGTGETRKLTDNDIPDYAPTWQCSTTRVVFTSDIAGNPDIYDAEALPITAPPIEVDEEAIQLTFALEDDIYPEGAPLEENASREGQLPNVDPLGQQTIFLEPDVSLTDIDLSLELSESEWTPIEGCAALPPEEE